MPCLTGDTLALVTTDDGGCSGGGGLVKFGKQFNSLAENEEKDRSKSLRLGGKSSVIDDSNRDASVVLLELPGLVEDDN